MLPTKDQVPEEEDRSPVPPAPEPPSLEDAQPARVDMPEGDAPPAHPPQDAHETEQHQGVGAEESPPGSNPTLADKLREGVAQRVGGQAGGALSAGRARSGSLQAQDPVERALRDTSARVARARGRYDEAQEDTLAARSILSERQGIERQAHDQLIRENEHAIESYRLIAEQCGQRIGRLEKENEALKGEEHDRD